MSVWGLEMSNDLSKVTLLVIIRPRFEFSFLIINFHPTKITPFNSLNEGLLKYYSLPNIDLGIEDLIAMKPLNSFRCGQCLHRIDYLVG